jgi:hypothetical protein
VLPPDFPVVSNRAWARVRDTPGYLAEREARFLMLAAAAAPGRGAIIEVGSLKGRSTVGLAIVAPSAESSPSEQVSCCISGLLTAWSRA